MDTESPETGEVKKPKKERKDVVFATPVYSKQIFTEEGQKNFDALPSWQRHLIKRIIDHGDMERAAEEAGVSTYVKKNIDGELAEKKTIVEALNHGGLTPDAIVAGLLECLEAKTIKFDKHQNPLAVTDYNLKLKTIELICKLRGLFDKKEESKKPNDVVELFKDTDV